MKEKIKEMLDLVIGNPDVSLEVNCDDTVTTLRRTGDYKSFIGGSEIKNFSDTEPEDCDGTLQQGIYYLKSITERQEA